MARYPYTSPDKTQKFEALGPVRRTVGIFSVFGCKSELFGAKLTTKPGIIRTNLQIAVRTKPPLEVSGLLLYNQGSYGEIPREDL